MFGMQYNEDIKQLKEGLSKQRTIAAMEFTCAVGLVNNIQSAIWRSIILFFGQERSGGEKRLMETHKRMTLCDELLLQLEKDPSPRNQEIAHQVINGNDITELMKGSAKRIERKHQILGSKLLSRIVKHAQWKELKSCFETTFKTYVNAVGSEHAAVSDEKVMDNITSSLEENEQFISASRSVGGLDLSFIKGVDRDLSTKLAVSRRADDQEPSPKGFASGVAVNLSESKVTAEKILPKDDADHTTQRGIKRG